MYIRNLLFTVIICCSICPGKVQAQNISGTNSWQEAHANKKAKVSILWYAIEPFIYFNKDKIVGIEYELMEGFKPFLKKNYGIELSINWVDAKAFEPIYPAIKKSKEKGLFAVSYYSITEERKKEVKFAPPYMPDLNILVTSNNLPVYNKEVDFTKDLKKFTGYSMAQTTMEEDMNKLRRIEPSLKVYNQLDDYEVLNQIAAINNAYGYVPLSMYVLALQKGTKIKRQKILATRREGLAAIYTKNSDWDEPVNAYFKSEDCKVLTRNLIRKHLGPEVADIILEVSEPDNNRRPTADIELLTKEREIVTQRLINTALQYQQSQTTRNITIVAGIIFIIISFVLYKMFNDKKRLANLLTLRNQEIIQQKQAIEKMNRQLQQKLAISQLNPHLIFNSLTAIQHFVMLDDKLTANKYLSQLSKFIRYLLQNAIEPFIGLEEEKIMLQQYLTLEQARFNQSFNFELNIEGKSGQIPSMLTFPFVEEALYERVLADERTTTKKYLRIDFKKSEKETVISIKDNSLAERKMESGTAVKISEGQIAALNKNQPNKIKVTRQTIESGSLVEINIPNTVLF